jgi:bifunctional non-homologous end joining protein LigD
MATRAAPAHAGVQITHPDRLLFPSAGVTKGDVFRYYETVADWILPHLRDRPLTLKQCAPDVEHCRYMRHAGERMPRDVRRIEVQEQRKVGEYMIIDDLPSLLTMAQRYIIEFHTWQSTAEHLEQPDRIVLDLDPGDEVPWPEVVALARLLRDMFASLRLTSWLKTTGGKGLHVVVPFKPEHGWETCLAFARAMATLAMQRDPTRYTITTAHRTARARVILIDYLRNARTATAVAAYSTRARPNASVSVPIAWDELTTRLKPDQWTIRNVPARLARLRADPWEGYWRARQKLSAPVLKAVGVNA